MKMKNTIIANWKMNRCNDTIEEYCALLANNEKTKENRVIIAPNFMDISLLSSLINHHQYPFSLAAQNCHHEKSGAYTGEISPSLLKKHSVGYVILGHSERRIYQKESEILLRQKVENALDHDLHVVFCIGESFEEHQQGKAKKILEAQLRGSIFSSMEPKNIIIAYEPVWAIGTGMASHNDDAEEKHAFIRSILASIFSVDHASMMPILYGGSVNADNASGYFDMPNINGALVGGASLKAESFARIIAAT